MFFAWLVANVEFELLKKLRGLHKLQMRSYYWSGRCDWQLLKDVNYYWLICLNNNVWFGWLNCMSNFLYHPHKAGNLKLCRLIVYLRRGRELRNKEYWVDSIGKWPMSFWNSFVGSSMKDNGSKTKFIGSIQVYPENLLKIVLYQDGRLVQGFLNT